MSNIIAGPWRRWIRNKFVCVVDEATDKEVIHWAGFDSSDFPHDVRAIASHVAAKLAVHPITISHYETGARKISCRSLSTLPGQPGLPGRPGLPGVG